MIFYRFSQINKKTKNLRSKNFIIKHIILYVQCVDPLMWSPTKLNFSFYDFFMIYNDFSKFELIFLKKKKKQTYGTVATAVTVAKQPSKPLEGGKMPRLKS